MKLILIFWGEWPNNQGDTKNGKTEKKRLKKRQI